MKLTYHQKEVILVYIIKEVFMQKFINQARLSIRKSPLLTSLVLVFAYFIAQNLVGIFMIHLPDWTIVYYLQEVLFMAVAL